MKEAVYDQSFVVSELELLAHRLSLGGRTCPREQAMFDAEHITEPASILVDQALHPSKYEKKFSKDHMLSTALKDAWVNLLHDRVITSNYLAVDNEINLKAMIDAIIEWDTIRYACVFTYLPAVNFAKVMENGPLSKHVVFIIMACYIISCHDGLLFYQYHNQTKIYHVNCDERICDSISNKCKEMIDFVLCGQVPPVKRLKKEKG